MDDLNTQSPELEDEAHAMETNKHNIGLRRRRAGRSAKYLVEKSKKRHESASGEYSDTLSSGSSHTDYSTYTSGLSTDNSRRRTEKKTKDKKNAP